jgi:hypothetical protein
MEVIVFAFWYYLFLFTALSVLVAFAIIRCMMMESKHYSQHFPHEENKSINFEKELVDNLEIGMETGLISKSSKLGYLT